MSVMLPLCQIWERRRINTDVFLDMHRWPLKGYIRNGCHQLLSERDLGGWNTEVGQGLFAPSHFHTF